MNIYAAIVVCHIGGCIALTDDHSPHATAEACEARLHEMRQAVAFVYRGYEGARMRAMCAPLDDVRQVIPGAFPNAEVWL